MSESDAEQAEKSTVLKHVANAAFPAVHLAPWMSDLKTEQAMLVIGAKTVGDIAEELDRRAWLDAHPGELLPASMGGPTSKEVRQKAMKDAGLTDEQISKIEDTLPPDKTVEEEEEEEMFRNDRVRGASGMMGYCVRQLAINTMDVMPAVKGIRVRQAMAFGSAQKSGVAVEPKPRSFFEKVTGRGKDREKISGGIMS